jgi:hypothetical protein
MRHCDENPKFLSSVVFFEGGNVIQGVSEIGALILAKNVA